MEKRRDVFHAISDPTRRQIIGLISINPLTVNAIAERFKTNRSTVSEHVKILYECGLVWVEQRGRERYCNARLEKLSKVETWVTQYKKHWHASLDSLEHFLDKKVVSKKKAKKR
ncbi:MAG: metalloregulator ArsR/SmtB family transcription factor [Chryseolinea sp.]